MNNVVMFENTLWTSVSWSFIRLPLKFGVEMLILLYQSYSYHEYSPPASLEAMTKGMAQAAAAQSVFMPCQVYHTAVARLAQQQTVAVYISFTE